MGLNQWLAIDAATLPLTRAREVRRAWERFVGEGLLGSVRAPIADSWQRSRRAGVDPSTDHVAPIASDAEETSARWRVHPLKLAVPLIRECLSPIADGQLIVVSDAEGVILWIEGDTRVRFAAADSMNFTEGAVWSEGGAGTNAIGTAVAADHAVQVFATEHFNEIVQQWTCSAAPVHDPDTGSLLGIIDVTGRLQTVHPHGLACAVATAHAVESQLRCEMLVHDGRLRSHYEQRVANRAKCALVTPTGRVIAGDAEALAGSERISLPPGGGELVLDSGVHAFAEPVGREDAYVVTVLDRTHRPSGRRLLRLNLLGRDRGEIQIDGVSTQLSRRQAEILALLSARPDGMTSEELAADVYGDSGQPGAIRVQVCRMRKLMGGLIETDPYRLSIDVESDVSRVHSLLERGAVKEAAERYQGPLLPHSEAPGVEREREELDRWLRHAVMTADDDEALWSWVQSAAGSDDLLAWKRLLSHLEFHDRRRSRAAMKVASLRAALGSGV
jgi:hypothetical protein